MSLARRVAVFLIARATAILPGAGIGLRIALAGCALSLALASESLAWTVSVTAEGQYIDPQINSFVYQDAQASIFQGPTNLSASVGEPYCNPLPQPCFYTWIIDSHASADLAAGRLGARASAFLGSRDEAVTARGLAALSDTITFHLPPNMSSASITLSMDVHATASIPPAQWLYVVGGSSFLDFGGMFDAVVWQDVPFGSGGFSRTLSATAIVQDGIPVDWSATLDAVVTVSPYLPGFQGGWYTFDGSHTATLSIVVPAGVTWDSESGVFLMQVPEPSTLQLVLAGVPGVFAAVRLRRRGWRQALSPSSRFGRVSACDDGAA